VGACVRSIWIQTEPASARTRIAARGHARDAWKLENWNAFVANARFGPPRDDVFTLRNEDQATLTDLVSQALNYLSST